MGRVVADIDQIDAVDFADVEQQRLLRVLGSETKYCLLTLAL